MMTINGEVWTIYLASPNHPIFRRSDGSYTIGVCDDNLKAIYINDSLSPKMTRKVLAHEITHAAMFSYNVFLSEDQEEILADLVATYGQEIMCNTNILFKRLKEERES